MGSAGTLQQWMADLQVKDIPYELHRNPTRLECSRTVAYFDDKELFTHWEAKDEPLIMIATEAMEERIGSKW